MVPWTRVPAPGQLEAPPDLLLVVVSAQQVSPGTQLRAPAWEAAAGTRTGKISPSLGLSGCGVWKNHPTEAQVGPVLEASGSARRTRRQKRKREGIN